MVHDDGTPHDENVAKIVAASNKLFREQQDKDREAEMEKKDRKAQTAEDSKPAALA